MKPETRDTLIWYGIMTIITIATILGAVCWGIKSVWRFFFKEKNMEVGK